MDKKLFLKLLIDTKTNRVLFAEAGKEVIDFLFGLLALPAGTIAQLLSKDGMVGCIGRLHSSLEKLDGSYLLSEEIKSSLLNPPVFSTQISDNILLLPSAPVTNKKIYGCSQGHNSYYTDIYGTTCPDCYGSNSMTKEIKYVGSSSEEGSSKEGGSGFVKGVVTYSLMDDLSVVPMSTISSITLLTKCQVKDLSSLQEKTVNLGMEEGLKLLKASLLCKNVLTTVFLGEARDMRYDNGVF